MKTLAALSLVLLLAACSDLTAPQRGEYGAVPIPTTSQYRAWWSHLEACSGLSGDINAVRFYSVDSLSNHDVGREYPATKQIYLVSIFVTDSLIVQHEMMHALLNVSGHPAQYFNGPCGDLLAGGGL